MKKYPSQEYLKSILDYNPDTGVFVWKKRSAASAKNHKQWNGKYAGKIAGSIKSPSPNSPKYVFIAITENGKTSIYYAHRLAWVIHYGELPMGEIDHINGDGLDNSINNLRIAGRVANSKNSKLSKSSTSGFCGVSYVKSEGRWRAYIKVNYRQIALGRFDHLEDAIKARKRANIKYGFHENHGMR